MRIHAISVLATALFCSTVVAQISQKEACQKYASAVVRIDSHLQLNTDQVSRGTGFLVSPEGWIFTAAHVVVNPETGKAYEGISVTLSNGSVEIAQVAPIESKMAAQMTGQDVAILKINGNNLPSLSLGDKQDDIVLGSDLTIIGFPFSAVGYQSNRPSIKEKFCLSGTVANSGNTDVSVSTNTPKESTPVNVHVDVIYFQRPSVKGLSGSPVISRDTGHVIAILTSRLTGINESLAEQRKALEHPKVMLTGGGFDLTQTLRDTIDVLDTQLANGLGAGTGIEDPKFALRSLLRKHHSQLKQNNNQ